jgi:hypothetical protein
MHVPFFTAHLPASIALAAFPDLLFGVDAPELDISWLDAKGVEQARRLRRDRIWTMF